MQALLVIPKTLAVNAAKDATDLIAKLRTYHNHAQKNEDKAYLGKVRADALRCLAAARVSSTSCHALRCQAAVHCWLQSCRCLRATSRFRVAMFVVCTCVGIRYFPVSLLLSAGFEMCCSAGANVRARSGTVVQPCVL